MESSQLRKTDSYETAAQSSSSDGSKSVVVDISGWRTAVEDAKAALGKTTTLLSSLETAIGGAMDQMVDKGVILDTYSGLVATMKEIKKLEGILGEHVSLKASRDPSTGAERIWLSFSGKQSRPFSSMTWEDLPSIRVKKEASTVPLDPLRWKLLADRETDKSYITAANKIIKKMRIDLQLWHSSLNYHSEAAARIPLDVCIWGLLMLILQVPFDSSGLGKAIVSPELLLSNALNQPEVIPTEDLTELTFLHGSTDYAITYIPNWRAMSVNDRIQVDEKLKGLSKLEAEGATFESGVRGSRIKLSLVEAKKMKTGDEKLVDCLPQVIAEAFVAGLRSNPKGMTPLAVPFILTDGFEWIFAILKHEPSADGSDDWTCIKTESHVVPVMGLEPEASTAAKSATTEALRVLLDMLIHWTCLDREVIIDQMAG
ncbi:hypothetical protein FS837_006929 [Tulasnella sp. UAMH 9824]|nr:hypothetical protein FS837_006929 [Tulasnella sp. UAMH 9824]